MSQVYSVFTLEKTRRIPAGANLEAVFSFFHIGGMKIRIEIEIVLLHIGGVEIKK
jgi:hypothetical protein